MVCGGDVAAAMIGSSTTPKSSPAKGDSYRLKDRDVGRASPRPTLTTTEDQTAHAGVKFRRT
jgi:hypothetical protein